MEKSSNFILVAFFITIAVVFIVNTSFLQIAYYDASDMFGPLSVYPLALLIELSLPVIFMVILLHNRKVSPLLFILPLLLFVGILYVGVELADASYVTSFYDAVGHFSRGLYVTVTGHSNPQIDSYFDTQPGFFYFTAIVSNVCGLNLTSWIDSALIFILKWTPIIVILASIPILYPFYKRLLSDHRLVSIALLLTFSLMVITFHYSAQSYGIILYWLILGIMFGLTNRRSSKSLILFFLIGLSLFCVHVGVTIMVLLSLIALVIYPMPFKVISRDSRFFRKEFLVLPVTLGIAWISYLTYLTVNQFSSVLTSITKAVESFLYEGTSIVSSSVTRAYEPWTQVVTYKSIFIILLIAFGLIFSFINAYKKRDEVDKLSFSLLFVSTLFFGGAAVGLGGAGYIERLPSLMMPIIVYSILKYMSNLKLPDKFHFQVDKHKTFSTLLIVMLLSVTLLAGSAVHLSGRNIQSVTYGELYSRTFLINSDSQNIAGVYSGLKSVYVDVIIRADLANASTDSYTVVNIQRRVILEAYYYTYANMSFFNQTINSLYGEWSVVYSNPDVTVFLRTDKIE